MTVTDERRATRPPERPPHTGDRSQPPPRRPSSMSSAYNSYRLPVSAAVATILSSLCLGGTFLTGSWFLPATFAVLCVVGAAELARRTAAPRSLVPVAGLAALLVYLVLRYAHAEAYFWVIPNRAALEQMRELADAGQTDISRYAAPIAVSPGIEFLVVAGVGLVALAVDTLAVTMRRAALAGLPLLALYTVPTTVAPTVSAGSPSHSAASAISRCCSPRPANESAGGAGRCATRRRGRTIGPRSRPRRWRRWVGGSEPRRWASR